MAVAPKKTKNKNNEVVEMILKHDWSDFYPNFTEGSSNWLLVTIVENVLSDFFQFFC